MSQSICGASNQQNERVRFDGMIVSWCVGVVVRGEDERGKETIVRRMVLID